ncbi:type I polyketide synthase [Streptomyces javensis]|uniref:type I polyketide synthase n=1 Tax=Streptomyces javensis TaxID=114698 RepID=UPI0033DF61FC
MTGHLAETDLTRLARMGIQALSTDDGLELFDRAAESPESLLLAARLDTRALGAADTNAPVHPMLRSLTHRPTHTRRRTRSASTTGRDTDEPDALRHRLLALRPEDRRKTVLDLVRTQLSAVLGHAIPEAVAPDRAFKDLGLDSLTSVDLRNRLSAATGLRLPATLAFDHPSGTALTDHLLTEILGAESTGLQPTAGIPAPTAPGAPLEDDLIAIVGMACRYPGGVTTPEELWRLVASGGDAIGGLPTDRGWDLNAIHDSDPDAPGRTYAREGGFLYDAGRFDADFFGISPVEALAMDPQQRLLLETGWEAVERAGIVPAALRGSRTGVFVGCHYQEYGPRLHEATQGAEGHLLTGTAGSVVSGRLAYVLGLEGPAVTVDTACSSSLVALHMAVRSLRAGECDLALAGGVAVMPGPGALMGFSRQRGLAADGRCKAFAADADGTSLAEGAGVLLVQRLSDARRDGRRVLGVVRGSAMNQDGASNGLSAPNGSAQRRVIRAALADARLGAADVDVVEAHGTGTPLGDPIEAQAVLATYGQRRRDENRPLWLGSVKSNIGHTQAAAGVAGVIKMVQALEHGVLPRSLHLDEPSDHVDWSSGEVELLRDSVAWPAEGRPRRAGVSSFGISGTNAHVIIEEAPHEDGSASEPPQPPARVGTLPWIVSGRSPAALRDQARRLLAHVRHMPDRGGPAPDDIAVALATERTVFEHRAVVLGVRQAALVTGLEALADDRAAPRLVLGGGAATTGRTAVLFTGQGSQRTGMGRTLYETYPVFADAFDAVCALFDALLPDQPPVRDVVLGHHERAELELSRTLYTQCGLFAVETALYRLVESWGVRPDYVGGHSIGEVVAAHVAGVLTLADACALVAARGRLMQQLPGGGTMVAVRLSEADVLPLLAGHRADVGVAAVNGPDAVVLSGAEDAVRGIVSVLRERGVETKRLDVSRAFHSPLMEPVLTAFRDEVSHLSYAAPEIPVISHLTGELLPADRPCGPDHWVRHIREPVRFADGVAALVAQGVTTFFELGPDGVLSALGQDCAPDAEFVPASRGDADERVSLTEAVARLFVRGTDVDWSAVLGTPGRTPRPVRIPTYAFQREDYWLRSSGAAPPRDTSPGGPLRDLMEHGDDVALATELALGDTENTAALLPLFASYRRHFHDDALVDGWRYRTAWKPVTLPSAALTGTWLVVVPERLTADPWVTGVTEALSGRATLMTVPVTDSGSLTGELGDAVAGTVSVSGVLSLLALAPGRDPEYDAVPQGVALALALLRSLDETGVRAPVWHATRSAVAVGGAERVCRPEQFGVRALGRVAVLETPERWTGTVDLPDGLDGWVGDRLAALLAQDIGESEIAIRGSGVFARRIVPAAVPAFPSAGSHTSTGAPPRVAAHWRPSGTVLITGGTGALGRQVALRLARTGAERLVLTSRRGPAAQGADALRDELISLGAQVDIVACDVGDRAAVAALLAGIPEDRPLTTVVHAAGVLDDGVLPRMTTARFQEVARAKCASARHLHDLTRDRDLTAFVLFSSFAGAVGAAGQANYVVANALLDALAEERRAAGLPVTCIAWGPWAEAGMAAADGAVGRTIGHSGLTPLRPDLALRALERAVAAGDSRVAVFDADWPRFAGHLAENPEVRPLARLFDGIQAVRQASTGMTLQRPQEPREFGRRLRTLPMSERGEELLRLVRTHAAIVLGHGTTDAVTPNRDFVEMGFDSLTATRLRNRLGSAIGIQVSAAAVFAHPTPSALTEHLLSLYGAPRTRRRPRLRPRGRG